MKKLIISLIAPTRDSNIVVELAMTLLRLYFGLTLALAHGISKVPPPDQLVSGVEKLGFPMPGLFAWFAASAEFLGGIFVALGLLTRPAAFFVAFTMGVAGFMVHRTDAFQRKELALIYLVIAIVFVFRGASRFSLDALLVWRQRY